MKTQQLKLSQRLGLAFLAMVLLTTAVGGFALKQLADVEEVSDELATKWLPSVKVLGDLRATSSTCCGAPKPTTC